MRDHLIIPPAPGRRFMAGELPSCPAAEALGIRRLFGSSGAESANHVARRQTAGDWIFLATLGGCGRVEVGARSMMAEPTTLFIMPPNTHFHEKACGAVAWSWICLRLTRTQRNPVLPDLPCEPWLGRPGLACFEHLSEIVARLYERSPGFDLVVTGRLLELFAVVAQLLQGRNRLAPSPFLETACAALRLDLARSWSVAEIARTCHMSTSAFAHRFKAETGQTPKQWLTAERMRQARSRLAEHASIDTVAAQLGYSSRYHFTQVFKRTEGIPPGRFQRLALRQ
ncbi:MAG: AraC family transcriptional regulator [Candidatus Marinimicrobia bacterium]|nr:AraC family transcriptional regulator [Candidatus Neomarinimicrobiota bacterium]